MYLMDSTENEGKSARFVLSCCYVVLHFFSINTYTGIICRLLLNKKKNANCLQEAGSRMVYHWLSSIKEQALAEWLVMVVFVSL